MIGHWDGTGASKEAAKPNWKSFKKLSSEVRDAILDGELMDGFQLTGRTGFLNKIPKPDWPNGFDLEDLRRAADLRDDRMNEIYAQQKDMMSFFGGLFNGSGSRFDRTIEFLDAALRFTVTVEMQCKFHFGIPRPIELAPEIMPIIQTPGHGSYPSGHAVESTVIYKLLEHFSGTPKNKKNLKSEVKNSPLAEPARRIRDRIAYNRVVAGVHYVKDNDGGFVLGENIFEYVRDKAIDCPRSPLGQLYRKARAEWH